MRLNPNRILSPLAIERWGHDSAWTASEREIKELMGLPPKAKWPAEGMATKVIQGVPVMVLSVTEARINMRFHRAEAICPQCGWRGSVGRLAQHICKE